uniref:Uncharacterized protein n=1 Tax=Pyrodinium bahamense TaxID=73915 RepID=A0A7R9ZWW4_9DINO
MPAQQLTLRPGTADRGRGVLAGASAQKYRLFEDVHAALRQLAEEVEIGENDEGLQAQIEEIGQDISNETHERKDSFSRLRTEFEVFVHHKAERVIHELEDFAREQAERDGVRWRTLLDADHDMDRLKLHLASISASWGLLANTLADPTRLPKSSQVTVESKSPRRTRGRASGPRPEEDLQLEEFGEDP